MRTTPVWLALTLAGGLGVGVLAGRQWPRAVADPPAAAPRPAEREVLYWYDPMVPQQHFDRPGKSPFMDMALLPRYADEAAGATATPGQPDTPGLSVPAAQVQRLGLRTAMVTRITAAAPVEASGVIGYDERAVTVLQSRAAGFVEQASPLAPGDVVAAGQPLLRLRLPEWAAAQAELLALRASGDAALLPTARERLRALGMDAAQVAELERSGSASGVYAVRAPVAGVIESLDARAGMALERGQTLARLRGLDPVWLEVAVPQALAGRVSPGADAEVHLDAQPAQTLRGRVTAVLPALAAESRSVRVRVALPNPDGRLRPGQAATVHLADSSTETALAVPTEAVIRTGTRTLVMRAHTSGGYTPQAVEIGPEVGDLTVIAAGLAEGDSVVASGQFLLDSEASLLGIGIDSRQAEPAAPAANGAAP